MRIYRFRLTALAAAFVFMLNFNPGEVQAESLVEEVQQALHQAEPGSEDDAWFMFSFDLTDDAWVSVKDTAIGLLARDEKILKLRDDLWSKVVEKIRKDPEAQGMEVMLETLGKAFVNARLDLRAKVLVDPASPMPLPQLQFSARGTYMAEAVTSFRMAMASQLEALEPQEVDGWTVYTFPIQPPIAVKLAIKEDAVLLNLDSNPDELPELASPPSWAADAPPGTFMHFFMNIREVLDVLIPQMAQMNPEGAQNFDIVSEFFGLEHMQTASVSLSGEGRSLISTGELSTDGELGPFWSIFEARTPASGELLRMGPKTLESMLCSIDLDKAIDLMISLAENFDPHAEASYQQGLEMFKMETGLDLHTDLLEHVGTSFMFAMEQGADPQSLLSLYGVSVDNPDALIASADKLTDQMLEGMTPEEQEALTIEKGEGSRVYKISIPSPNGEFQNVNISLKDGMLRAAMEMAFPPELGFELPQLSERPRDNLDVSFPDDADMIWFRDGAAVWEVFHGLILVAMEGIAQDELGKSLGGYELPDAEFLSRLAGYDYGWLIIDEEGLHSKSIQTVLEE